MQGGPCGRGAQEGPDIRDDGLKSSAGLYEGNKLASGMICQCLMKPRLSFLMKYEYYYLTLNQIRIYICKDHLLGEL